MMNKKNLDSLLCNTAILLGKIKLSEQDFCAIKIPEIDELQPELYKIIKANSELFGDVLFDTNSPVPYSREIEEYLSDKKLTGTAANISMRSNIIEMFFHAREVKATDEMLYESAKLAKDIIDNQSKFSDYFGLEDGKK